MGRKKSIRFTLIILILTLLIGGCSESDEDKTLTGSNFKFDTMVSFTLIGTDDPAVLESLYEQMDEIESMISAHDETSLVSNFNHSETDSIEVPEILTEIISKSLYYSEISAGKFDITVFPLAELWGIGTEDAKVPSEEALEKILSHVDYKNLSLEGNTLSKLDSNIQIDLGGIAKGYAADYLVSSLRDQGIENGIIDLGGNLYLMGTKASGEEWVAGIQNPNDDRGDYIATLEVSNKSIVTSGPYERYFEEDGIKYHHILDTETGYPVNNGLAGVSIISDYSIDGDALSTTVYALGLEEGLKLLNDLDGIDGLIITSDNLIYASDDFGYNLKITDDSYKIFQ